MLCLDSWKLLIGCFLIEWERARDKDGGWRMEDDRRWWKRRARRRWWWWWWWWCGGGGERRGCAALVRSANSLSLAGMFKYVDTLSSLLESGGR